MTKSKLATDKNPLIKTAEFEDEMSGNVYTEFRFLKALKRQGKVRIENDKAHDPLALKKQLILKGAILPSKKEDARRLITEAIDAPAPRHMLYSRQLGWRTKVGDGYVLPPPAGAIGVPKGKLRLRPPMWLNDLQHASFTQCGSLEGWQAEIGGPARYSDLIMTVIAAAFGAVMVGKSGLQNFGLNIYGGSKSGKTTALLCATSVGGIGRERNLPNWNSTPGGFLETARCFNDRLLPVNEVGLLAGKKRDAYSTIRERIFTFSEGRERTRMSASSMSVPGNMATWGGIFVSTSEFSFGEYADFASEARAEGEYARCLDIPVIGKGKRTIFNRYPKSNKKGRRAWAREMLGKLRRSCERYQGEPLIAFVSPSYSPHARDSLADVA